MVACSICDEEYGEDRPPLLLGCCQGMHLCEQCILQHMKMGTNKCIICPARPSVRNYVAQCKSATPTDFLEELKKKERVQLEEESRTKPKPVELGKAGLLDVFIKAGEKEGDAEVALQLQMTIEQEERDAVEKASYRDLQMARRLQEMEEQERANLKKRLTKAPDVSGFRQHGRATDRNHSKGTLTLHSYFDRPKDNDREKDKENVAGPPSKRPRVRPEEVFVID